MSANEGWTRRDLGGAVAMLALVLGVPAAVVHLSDLGGEDAPTDRQRRLMREVSQLVIPRSTTPGAGDVGTGDFVILALAHGLDASRAPVASAAAQRPDWKLRSDGSLKHVDWLETQLDRKAGGDFLRLDPRARAQLLAAFDAAAYPPGPPPQEASPWQTIKSLILTGYYTSEVGASRELRYELVPGRFDPDLPLSAGDRAWSSDWTAVEFG